jgi:hypothetical protein
VGGVARIQVVDDTYSVVGVHRRRRNVGIRPFAGYDWKVMGYDSGISTQ